ncbi:MULTISPECIES: hypothetical protein [Pacificimonas]|nr:MULTISPECIES: hypothetical protein [Pacificimonas]MBZ6379227.1 hypothetical protein [Pacificimonas aurantium]
MDDWCGSLIEQPFDEKEEKFTLLLAAAARRRRANDPELTISKIHERFDLAPVTLSRVEHAQRPFSKWNPEMLQRVCAFLGVSEASDLKAFVTEQFEAGLLTPFLAHLPTAQDRESAAKEHAVMLRETAAGHLTEESPSRPNAALGASAPHIGEHLPVLGFPLPDGLIDPRPTGEEVPVLISPDNLFALRICRPVLGMGMPATAVLIADRSRFPQPGGLCIQNLGKACRVLAVMVDSDGGLVGRSKRPDVSVALDELDPDLLSAVVGAWFAPS